MDWGARECAFASHQYTRRLCNKQTETTVRQWNCQPQQVHAPTPSRSRLHSRGIACVGRCQSGTKQNARAPSAVSLHTHVIDFNQMQNRKKCSKILFRLIRILFGCRGSWLLARGMHLAEISIWCKFGSFRISNYETPAFFYFRERFIRHFWKQIQIL